MPTGIFNPLDDSRATSTAPTYTGALAGVRRWFSNALRTKIKAEDLNFIIDTLRAIGDDNGVADAEGDVNYLRTALRNMTRDRVQAVSASISSGTVDLAAQSSYFVSITGGGTVTSFGTGAGSANRVRMVYAAAETVIQHNATSLVCPAARDLRLFAGDHFLVWSNGSGTQWRIAWVARVSGRPAVPLTDPAQGLLINPAGRVRQRGTGVATSDDTYGLHDRWYLLTQTTQATPSQLTDVADGIPNMMRITNTHVGGQRTGYAQIIESDRSKALRGRTVTLLGKVRRSDNALSRYAILEWTGTADNVTSDVVLDWTSASYAPGGFFQANNLVVAANGSLNPGANTIGDIELQANISSACNNLIVVFWTSTAMGANTGTFDFLAQLFADQAGKTTIDPRPYPLELAMCQRYFERIGGDIAAKRFARGYADSSTRGLFDLFYTPKRTTPVIAINGAAGTDYRLSRQGNAVVNPTAIAATAGAISDRSCEIDVTVASGLTAGEGLGFRALTTTGSIDVSAEL